MLLRTTLLEGGGGVDSSGNVVGAVSGWGSGSRPFYIGLYFPSRESKMEGGWYPFGWNLMTRLVPKPGVFEVADEDGMTIYIAMRRICAFVLSVCYPNLILKKFADTLKCVTTNTE